MNLKTAARRLGVHYQTAYRWVRSGQLLAVKVGSGYEISEAALERFEAQRIATERLPERIDASESAAFGAAMSNKTALHVLDRMTDAVTTDPAAVTARAVRVLAEVLGDGVILYRTDAAGHLAGEQLAHRDPESEVRLATVATHTCITEDLVRQATRTGDPLFVPQVPQREVRRRLPPEMHELLLESGCYSLMVVPVGDDAALVVTRDVPGRPYTRDDLEFATDVATRVVLASERARRWSEAAALRRALDGMLAHAANTSQPAAELPKLTLEHLLETAVGNDPDASVAVLDLHLQHLVCTKAYAALIGDDPTRIDCEKLSTYVYGDVASLYGVLKGELDCRTVNLTLAERHERVTLHAAMVRRSDATPWGVLIVAHVVPELAHN